jgi:hypothetical protein
MTTITKERVKDILEFGAARIISPITDDEIMALARIALASLEAEPVVYIRDGFRTDGVHFCGGIISAKEYERTKPALSERYNWKHQPLYTVPPAPVVPEEMYWQDAPVEGSSKAAAYATGWNACRAAMLQGKSEPGKQD